MPSLVEIGNSGSGEEDENVKSLQTDGMNGQTDASDEIENHIHCGLNRTRTYLLSVVFCLLLGTLSLLYQLNLVCYNRRETQKRFV